MTHGRVHKAPFPGDAHTGRTLPSLAYDGASRYPSDKLISRPGEKGWKSYSSSEFCRLSEDMALGLTALGLERGDRVGMYMFSDVNFCVVDMGCLMGSFTDVPLYLTHDPEAVAYILSHSTARALIVSNQEQFEYVWPVVRELESLEFVIVVRSADHGRVTRTSERVKIVSMDHVLEWGADAREADPESPRRLVAAIAPNDLATIIYTSGTTGRPKGVMLTHGNISSNALTSFSELKGYRSGSDGEIGISFLPLTHVFARTLHYGFLAHGTPNHFVQPEELPERLLEVRPTIFATVPRVLEKVYAKIQAKSDMQTGLRRKLAMKALDLARRYVVGTTMPIGFRLQHAMIDPFVYARWREGLGGRVRFVIAGGAALNAELTNVFGAAGVNILQGYGLTETSPVITFNRPGRNRAGTVGEPIPGVEVTIAEDGEVLTRGPHVMIGYFLDDKNTSDVMDADGWFHTGDVGHFNEEGRLVITDRKKDLFKLSTGKYVAPQPLENRLTNESLIEQVVVLGPGRKFCAALIFPNMDAVRRLATKLGLPDALTDERLLQQEAVLAAFQKSVDVANTGLNKWETIKKFTLVPADVTVESGLLTPTLKIRRPVVNQRFADTVTRMYEEADQV